LLIISKVKVASICAKDDELVFKYQQDLSCITACCKQEYQKIIGC